ncbi:NAD(P)-binding protein [Suillus fuscotomentosus]|uniref:NAD(P)-binding protein n=1 Tax=Suillus fuscotomentosus TaxID=1912939 RepID=A0AAD4ELF5_9AGAM|nr:NAD(P)-binding protein [Suillus fuscotomentosus]KAG1908364.1 NAD(P)-binding protein [Suillus fuscotomentosus]
MASNLLQTPALHAGTIPFSRPPTPGVHPLQIGFCGLGAMGYLMARNLANSLILNRLSSFADTLDQLATECDVIFTCLANDAVVISQSPPTKVKIFVEMGTNYPALAGDLDRMLSSFPHTRFITSPIFGAPPAADKATLVIAMSGDHRSKKEVAFLLVPAVGRKVIDLGENVEKASTLKLIGNGNLAAILELLAETLTLGEKSGIGQQTVYDLITEIMPAPAIISYGKKMINDSFDGSVGFSMDGGIKDSSLVYRRSDLGSLLDTHSFIVSNAHRSMITTRAIHQAQVVSGTQQWDIVDESALIASSRVAAGLDPFNSKKGTTVVREE